MENKDDIVNNLLCMACLCVGRSILEVRDEKSKKYYLDILNEIPLNDIKLVVPIICWECEAILHKVLAFREQVKDSYRILQTYTENLNECLLSDVSRSPRLKVHTNTPISIIADNLNDIKLEKNDNNKSENQNNSNANISDGEPNEDIQTVICDVKRYKRKKKSIHKMRKISRQDDKDPVDITNEKGNLQDVKIEEKILENMLNQTNDSSIDLRKKDEIMLNETNTDMKIELNNAVIEMDDIKSEFDDKEDNLDNSASESDIKDIDTEIQSFLDNVKKNTDKNRSKSKKKCHTETKTKIITVDLSYEEMQAERTKMSEKDSFLNAKYKCESCLIVFNTEVSMKTHRSKKHEVKGDFICSICKTIISSVEAFTTHYKRHMRRYECPICGKRTPDLKTIQQHIYSKHNNDKTLKKYQCNVCGKISNSLDTHRYHRDTHRARVECSQCDKTFSHRAGLMNHRLAVHESQNEFPCTVCNKVFRWKTSLKRHLEKHDNESKGTNSTNRAFCISCGIGFSSVCSYQRHLRNSLKHVTHDQLKFICDHCNQRFADKTKLRDHIEEKHLHRTFQCPICNKPSKNRVGLEQHIRAVHKGRPNNRMCHHCGKGFPTKVQLESHIRTHTGERPFMCEFCPTTFSQQSNLYKHHRQVHLNIKSKRYLCKKSRHDGNSTSDPPFTLPIMQYIPENGFSL